MINLVLSNLRLDGDQLRWKTKEPFKTMVLCNEMNSLLRRLDYLRYTIVTFRNGTIAEPSQTT